MLTGYADVNVKLPIVTGLRTRGMDVVTAQERGQERAPDEVLLETATSEGRLLLTNDTDFLGIHSEWLRTGKSHAGIVYWHQDTVIGEAIRRLVHYASQTSAADAANTLKYL